MLTGEHVKVVTGLKGVDLFSDPTQMDPQRFRRLQNFYPPRSSAHILAKRLGSVIYNASAISGATKVDNMVRAWKADGSKKLIVAATKGGADELHALDDIAGTFSQITGGSALPAGKRWFFVNWPLLGKVYALCGDGTVPIQISSDLATKTDMAAPAPNLPDARFGQFGTIFYSRLLTARTPSNPGFYYFFDVASDTAITNASQFGRIFEPITAMGTTPFATSGASLQEMLLLFGAHSTWYVAGDPTTTAPQRASAVVGCKSPKTFCSTPAGAMFLGSDRMVYLINADPKLPQKVGIRILPELLNIPETRLIDACAVYHNYFYKLRFATPGGATNAIEYWGDLLPLILGLPDAEVEWYGPMLNTNFLSMVVEDGPDDGLALIGGSGSDGRVWQLDRTSFYFDNATTVEGRIITPEFAEGDPLREKIWAGFTFGFLKVDTGQLQVDVVLNAGQTRQSKAHTWSVSTAQWDVAKWDVDAWAGGFFDEDAVDWDARLVGHTMQLALTHNVASDYQLRDYGRRYVVIPRLP